MTRLGIQISSVRDYLQMPSDVLESFRKVSRMGYRSIQIQWISPDIPADFIGNALKDCSLRCVGTQDYYDAVMENLDDIIEMNDLWGGDYICVSGIPERYHSRQGCMEFAEELNRVSIALEARGKILTFHPRCQDFLIFDGESAMEIMLENTRKEFQIELDVYHVVKAGYDPVQWIHKVKGRMDLIHFKDMKALPDGKEVLTPIGQGDIRWEEVFKACIDTGVKYGFAEQESWEKDPFECLEESYRFISSFGIK